MCGGVLAHVCEPGGPKSMAGVFLHPSPHYIFFFQHSLQLTDSAIRADHEALGSSCPCLVSVLGSFYIFKVVLLNVYLCMYLCVCHICDTLGAPKMVSYLVAGGCEPPDVGTRN